MFPVLKNTYTGILGVEERYLEAARGCGMSPFQTLIRVELPLAMPIIIAGLRMAAIYTVSWAVLASMIGLGGLGDFVYRGTSSNNNTLILLGAIPAAVLAILFGVLIDLLQRRLLPADFGRRQADELGLDFPTPVHCSCGKPALYSGRGLPLGIWAYVSKGVRPVILGLWTCCKPSPPWHYSASLWWCWTPESPP